MPRLRSWLDFKDPKVVQSPEDERKAKNILTIDSTPAEKEAHALRAKVDELQAQAERRERQRQSDSSELARKLEAQVCACAWEHASMRAWESTGGHGSMREHVRVRTRLSVERRSGGCARTARGLLPVRATQRPASARPTACPPAPGPFGTCCA